jgi:hypothetical protein
MAEILVPAATASEMSGLTERTLRSLSRPAIERVRIGDQVYYRESEILALKGGAPRPC